MKNANRQATEICKGVNLGGWLLMEGYILQARNRGEHILKREFAEHVGKPALKEFEKAFRDNFITEEDFKNIAKMGAKVIRLPFNCRLVEKEPYKYSKEGLGYIEKALNLANKHKLKIILDLHAAPGAQNYDWHGDSDGRAMLWKVEENRKRTYALWDAVSSEFSNHPGLQGYDLLNESVMPKEKVGMLADFYKNCIKKVRTNDNEHKIYLEGNNWAQQIDFLVPLLDENIVVSIHAYEPLHFTFSFNKLLKYPDTINEGYSKGLWNRQAMYKYLKPYHDFAKKHKTHIYVGEFGINWRGGYWGELNWLNDILSVFEDYGFSYTYWTYKAVANHMFPDGIYQYLPCNDFTFRFYHEPGWENYKNVWNKQKTALIDSWRTKNYTPNKPIINTLSKYFKK